MWDHLKVIVRSYLNKCALGITRNTFVYSVNISSCFSMHYVDICGLL